MIRAIGGQYPKVSLQLMIVDLRRLLCRGSGWVAQEKINGRRCEIHIKDGECQYFTRQGRPHTRKISREIEETLLKYFDDCVLDAEWVPQANQMFVFDQLAKGGRILRCGFSERHSMIYRDFISPFVKVLPLIRSVTTAKKIMLSDDDLIEGLVFKHETSRDPTAILRARKKDHKL